MTMKNLLLIPIQNFLYCSQRNMILITKDFIYPNYFPVKYIEVWTVTD